ncbi:MAG: hypothetical protein HRT88_18195, partial [Lentisphaeraceae bacterium]|nr:hypothetical protein [Lentisphaeraceae bacterium]
MARPKKAIKNEKPIGTVGRVQIICPANNFKRGKRSLKTSDALLISLIEKDLNILRDCNIVDRDRAPMDMHPLAIAVWFGNDALAISPSDKETTVAVTKEFDEVKAVSLLEDEQPSANEEVHKPRNLMLKYSMVLNDNVSLRQENQRLHGELLKMKERYEALSKTIEGQRISAIKSCPSWGEAIERFKIHASEVRDLKRYVSLVNKFREFFPDLDTPAQATRNNFLDFLDDYKKDGKDPAAKWNRTKSNLSPFFKWAAKRYKFLDEFPDGQDKKKEKVRTKVFHSKKEINEV